MFFIAESYRHFVSFVRIMRSPRGTTTTTTMKTTMIINHIPTTLDEVREAAFREGSILNSGLAVLVTITTTFGDVDVYKNGDIKLTQDRDPNLSQ